MDQGESFLIACLNHLPRDALFNPSRSILSVKRDGVESYQGTCAKKHIRYRMTVKESDVQYLGKALPDFGSSSSSSGSSWCVLIRNKTTGKCAVHATQIVNFNTEIQGDSEHDKTIVDKDESIERRQMLTMQYGSKKKKRALESRLANSVNNDSLSNMISLAMSKAQGSISDKLQNQMDKELDNENDYLNSSLNQGNALNPRSSVLPPFNPHASVPSEIFNLNDLVAPEEVALLSQQAADLAKMSDQQRKEAGLSTFICELAVNLPNRPESKQTRLVYLLYLDYLLKILRLSNNVRNFQASSVEKFVQKPELARRILDKYAERQSFKRKGISFRLLSAGKDRLLSHVIVLLLHSTDFSFELSKLVNEVDMPDQKISAICNALGCKTKRIQMTGAKLVTLTKPPEEKANPYLGSASKKRRTQ